MHVSHNGGYLTTKNCTYHFFVSTRKKCISCCKYQLPCIDCNEDWSKFCQIVICTGLCYCRCSECWSGITERKHYFHFIWGKANISHSLIASFELWIAIYMYVPVFVKICTIERNKKLPCYGVNALFQNQISSYFVTI